MTTSRTRPLLSGTLLVEGLVEYHKDDLSELIPVEGLVKHKKRSAF
jgi:hypothetical protein